MSVLSYKMAEMIARAIRDNPEKWPKELRIVSEWFFRTTEVGYWARPENMARFDKECMVARDLRRHLPENYQEILAEIYGLKGEQDSGDGEKI